MTSTRPRPIIRWLRDTRGATAIEYGLIAGLIAAAIFGGVAAYGDALEELYVNRIGARVGAALN